MKNQALLDDLSNSITLQLIDYESYLWDKTISIMVSKVPIKIFEVLDKNEQGYLMTAFMAYIDSLHSYFHLKG